MRLLDLCIDDTFGIGKKQYWCLLVLLLQLMQTVSRQQCISSLISSLFYRFTLTFILLSKKYRLFLILFLVNLNY